MRKWLIGCVVLLLLFGGVLAYVVATLNRHLAANRDWLTAQAEAALGRPVRFDAIEASVLGGVGVRVTHLRIADDPAFSESDFLRARTLAVRVKVLPMLFGRYEVRRVSLVEPQLTIVRRPEGMNFETLGTARRPGGEPRVAGGDVPARAPVLLVALLAMRDGQVRFVDRTVEPPAETVIRALDVDASDLSLTAPLHLEVRAAILGSADRNLTLRGTVGPLGNPPVARATPVDLTLRVAGLDLAALRRDLPAVAARLPPGLELGGTLTADGHARGTADRLALDGTLDLTPADIRRGVTVRKPVGMPLRAAFRGARAGDAVAVERLGLRIADLEVVVAGRLTIATPPVVELTLDSAAAPLGGWDRLLPALEGYDVAGTLETHLTVKGRVDPPALPAITGTAALAGVAARKKGAPYEIEGLEGTMTFRGDAADLPGARFKLGGAPVEVSLRVEGLAAPRVRPGVVVTGRVVSTGGSLRDLSFDGLRATLAYQDGIATVDDIDVRAYGGTYAGRVRVDGRDPATPRFETRSTVRGMAIDQLVATRAPAVARAVQGRLDADMTLAGAGTGWEAGKRSLRGQGELAVRDGALKDVNVAEQVLGGAGIPGLTALVPPRVRAKYPGVFATGETRFERLGGTVVVADGVARTDDLVIAARDYVIRGAGTMTLDGEVEATATLVASEALTRDLTADVHEARYLTDAGGRVALPFRVGGTPPRLHARPDAAAIAAALQRGLVEKGIDALLGGKGKQKGTPDSAADRLRKELGGLLGR